MKRRSFCGVTVAGIVGLFVKKKSIEPGGKRFGVTGGNCVNGLMKVWIPNHLSDEEIKKLRAEFEKPRFDHIIVVDEADGVTWHT